MTCTAYRIWLTYPAGVSAVPLLKFTQLLPNILNWTVRNARPKASCVNCVKRVTFSSHSTTTPPSVMTVLLFSTGIVTMITRPHVRAVQECWNGNMRSPRTCRWTWQMDESQILSKIFRVRTCLIFSLFVLDVLTMLLLASELTLMKCDQDRRKTSHFEYINIELLVTVIYLQSKEKSSLTNFNNGMFLLRMWPWDQFNFFLYVILGSMLFKGPGKNTTRLHYVLLYIYNPVIHCGLMQ